MSDQHQVDPSTNVSAYHNRPPRIMRSSKQEVRVVVSLDHLHGLLYKMLRGLMWM